MRRMQSRILSGLFCFAALVATYLSHPSPAYAQVAKIEVYPLESTTLTDEDFLAGKKEGKPVTLAGELRIPTPGAARLPAVVLIHGSGGVSGYIGDWAQFQPTGHRLKHPSILFDRRRTSARGFHATEKLSCHEAERICIGILSGNAVYLFLS